jgi:hypothetical protein
VHESSDEAGPPAVVEYLSGGEGRGEQSLVFVDVLVQLRIARSYCS